MSDANDKHPDATDRPGRFQFYISDLLVLTVIVAVCCSAGAIWGPMGLLLALFLALLLVFAASPRFRRPSLIGLLPVFLLIVTALFFPANCSVREAPRRYRCEYNLKQIGLALHSYHTTYGCFPPPVVEDRQGRPLYGWRVLLLPHLHQSILYKRWHLDEPWDSPHNRPLADVQLDIFHCPSAIRPPGSPKGATDYLAIVGPGMAWQKGKALELSDFADGASKTVMVVEVPNSNVNWAEPVDLDRATMSLKINDPNQPSIGSEHPGGANVLYVDGSVHSWWDDRPVAHIEPMLTRDGGEPVDPKWDP